MPELITVKQSNHPNGLTDMTIHTDAWSHLKSILMKFTGRAGAEPFQSILIALVLDRPKDYKKWIPKDS